LRFKIIFPVIFQTLAFVVNDAWVVHKLACGRFGDQISARLIQTGLQTARQSPLPKHQQVAVLSIMSQRLALLTYCMLWRLGEI